MIIAEFSDELFDYPFVVLRPDSTWPWFVVDPRHPEAIAELEEFVSVWDEPVKRC